MGFYIYKIQASYSIIFIVRIHSSIESNSIAYITETRSKNQTLRNRNPIAWDSGMTTIGTIFCITNPFPVESLMPGHVPLLVTTSPVIITNRPTYFITVLIQQDLEAISTMDLCKNRIVLSVGPLIALRKPYADKLCGRQRVNDWNGEGGHKKPVDITITLVVGRPLLFSMTLMF